MVKSASRSSHQLSLLDFLEFVFIWGVWSETDATRTAISSKTTAVKFFGQNHRRPAKIDAIFVHCLAKSELGKCRA